MATNESVTPSPQAAATTSIPLPPPAVGPAPSVEDRVAPAAARLDALLVLAVVAFAFLSASFAAANSDFFLQTAAGRLLAEGRYHFGVDPFACTTEGVYWTNHSWLFGVVTHAVYDSFPGHGADDACIGGIILVVAKAVLVAVLAGLMIATGRQRGQSLWIPAACAALAVLAMSPRLFLHSTTLSYLYLGLTLFLLRRPRWDAPPQPETPAKKGKAKDAAPVAVGYPFKALWAIPPLCLLWVNTDGWFLLGPIAVGLYLAGGLIEQAQTHAADRGDRPAPGELKTLVFVWLASVLVCFINPHHYHAFMPPEQLGLTDGAKTLLLAEQDRIPGVLPENTQFRPVFVSPLDDLYYNQTVIGKNVAGIAYYPLLALGFVSFALNFRALRPWRIMLWLPFAVLSLFSARAIPFFAVVGGPLMALNFLDVGARVGTLAFANEKGWHAWRVIGRVLCVVAAIALIVGTVPGWVQAQPFERRRVAFHVHVEPSWKAAGAQLALWRQQGLISDADGWFNLSPDVANYMAYFGDGERGFLDLRLQLYDPAAAGDYVKVRDGLGSLGDEESSPNEPPPPEAPWRVVFAKRKVRYVILYNESSRPPRKTYLKAMVRMLHTPAEFTPLYANGDVYIFGWNAPQQKPLPQWATMRLNDDREAFGPAAQPVERAHPPAAPHAREWYEALWLPEKPRSPAVNLSMFRQLSQDARMGAWQQEEFSRWQATMGTAGCALGVPGTYAFIQPNIQGAHEASLDPPAPSGTYLTIRQIQQSLADNPDDPGAYVALARAYSQLLWSTKERERSFNQGFPHVALIRHTQIVTALNQAIKLDPDLDAAHQLLAEHYANCRRLGLPNYLDHIPKTTFFDVQLQ